MAASVGSKSDSYDNALAESFHGLYKAELIRHRGPWRGLEMSSMARWSTRTGSTTTDSRGPLDFFPPAEFRYLSAQAKTKSGPAEASGPDIFGTLHFRMTSQSW